MPQRYDPNTGYAIDAIADTDDVAKRTPANVRPVKLKGSDPVVYAMVEDRTFDPAAYEELTAAEQDVARDALKALKA